MNSQELRALQEAYIQVYELDEANRAERELKLTPRQREISRNLRDKNTMTKPSRRKPDSDFYNPEKLISRAYDNESDSWHDSMSQSRRLKRNLNKEEVDLYDIILSHLLDEGYAETQEQAEVIMVNMSEDWRESIVEEIYIDENKMDKELNTPNWDKVYDRNNRDYGPNHTSKPKRRPSGKLETPNQTTQRLGKERVQSHKDTRGVKKIPGAKGIRMQFGRAF